MSRVRSRVLCLAIISIAAACATVESATDTAELCALYDYDGDVVSGGGGNDQIFGGRGIDIAIYRGPRSSYVIVRNRDFVSINGPDGIDIAGAVDLLVFEDVVLNLYAAMSRAGAPRMGVLDTIPVWPVPVSSPRAVENALIDRAAILAPCIAGKEVSRMS